MELVKPNTQYEASYDAYIRELGDEERYPYPMDLAFENFADLVELLNGFSRGEGLFPNMVPNTTFWLVEKAEIIGVSHLRHRLNTSLRHMGGHIGLGIRPKYRGQGLSKKLLMLTINEAFKKDIVQLHIHCHKGNKASSRMIVSCGGYLESELLSDPKNEQSEVVQRYYVDKSLS